MADVINSVSNVKCEGESRVEECYDLTNPTTELCILWTPIEKGSVRLQVGSDVYYDDACGNLVKNPGHIYKITTISEDGHEKTELEFVGGLVVGTISYANNPGIKLNEAIKGCVTLKYRFNSDAKKMSVWTINAGNV